MMQGLSVLAMVWLHLFDRWDYEGLYTPILFFKGIPLSFFIGQLSDFCVMGFAFCSGYAHMTMFGESGYYKRRLKGLLSLYCNLWLVIAVFSIISFFAGQGERMPGSVSLLLKNMAGIGPFYCGAWWYVFTYALLVVTSPVLLRLMQNCRTEFVLIAAFLVYFSAYIFRFKIGPEQWFFKQYGTFGMTAFEYLLGAACYKDRWFARLCCVCERIGKRIAWPLLLVGFLAALFGHTLIIPSLFVAPLTGFYVLFMFFYWRKPDAVERFFLLIGKHSTNIWLTHMFFYLSLFDGWVYVAKYPILIFALMILVTLLVSVGINFVLSPIQHRINVL